MTTPAKSTPAWFAWIPFFTTVLLLAGLLMAFGGRINELDQHEYRIVKLEAKGDTNADKLDKINERTARIEAKLEVLVPSTGAGDKVSMK